jgi:GTP-binding protein
MKSKDALPEVIEASFVAEVRTLDGLLAEGPPEVAIAGRSNVGKSSLLNRLAARRSLARTSKTPGRTRGLVLYDLVTRFPDEEVGAREQLRLVDLPGYGYAQVSHEERKSWQTLVEGYVKARGSLRLCLILVDARRDLELEEAQLIEWLETLPMPHRIVITKVDKLSAGERGAATAKFRAAGGSPLFVSGQTGEGVDRLWRVIRAACRPAAAVPEDDDRR